MCELALESEAPLVDEHLLLASAAAGHAARVVRALSDVEHDLRGTWRVARGRARARAATRGALTSGSTHGGKRSTAFFSRHPRRHESRTRCCALLHCSLYARATPGSRSRGRTRSLWKGIP